MSEINPYAAPAGPVDLAPERGEQPFGPPLPWEAVAVFKTAWRIFQLQWPVLVGATAVSIVLCIGLYRLAAALIPGFVPPPRGASPGLHLDVLQSGFWLRLVFRSVVTSAVELGLLRIFLQAARLETPRFTTLFALGPRYFPLVAVNLVAGFATQLGVLLLVVPGVVAMLGLFYAPFLVVDSERGVVEALRTSWRVSTGQKASLFGLVAASGVLTIAGVIALGVGLLVTFPLCILALCIVFDRITGRSVPALT